MELIMDDKLKEQQKAYADLQISNNEYNRNRRKKKFIILFIIVVIVLIIKIFFGTINIINKLNFLDNPGYEIKVNNELVQTNVESKKTTSIIPFLVNWISYNIDLTKGKDLSGKYKTELGNEITLSIQAYECYSDIVDNKMQIECQYDNEKLIKKDIENIRYSMKITSTSKSIGLIYEGKMKENITDLFKSKGNYEVIISTEYENIESNIYFYIELI